MNVGHWHITTDVVSKLVHIRYAQEMHAQSRMTDCDNSKLGKLAKFKGETAIIGYTGLILTEMNFESNGIVL